MNIFRSVLVSGMAVAALSGAVSAKAQDHYFQYPTAPDNLVTLSERTNFIVEHFWERCNLKSAFSSLQKMQGAFNDYVAFMPYADADVVHASIESLIKEVSKNPKNLLSLAEMAEGALYADTAQLLCDECYLPFAQAVANSKKISKTDKARFEYQAKILSGAQLGMIAPDFTYTTLSGEQKRLSDIPGSPYIILFINDPDCDECELARVRLGADHNLSDFIERGQVVVISIYPGEISDEWIEKAKSYSSKWIVGASSEIGELYDLRYPPVIYYLDAHKKILSKTIGIDDLLEGLHRVNVKQSR